MCRSQFVLGMMVILEGMKVWKLELSCVEVIMLVDDDVKLQSFNFLLSFLHLIELVKR